MLWPIFVPWCYMLNISSCPDFLLGCLCGIGDTMTSIATKSIRGILCVTWLISIKFGKTVRTLSNLSLVIWMLSALVAYALIWSDKCLTLGTYCTSSKNLALLIIQHPLPNNWKQSLIIRQRLCVYYRASCYIPCLLCWAQDAIGHIVTTSVYAHVLCRSCWKCFVQKFWQHFLTTSAFFASWPTFDDKRDGDGFFPSRVECRSSDVHVLITQLIHHWSQCRDCQLCFFVLIVFMCTKSTDLAYTLQCSPHAKFKAWQKGVVGVEPMATSRAWISSFPHQRKFCTVGLLGRHALCMLGRTLCCHVSYYVIACNRACVLHSCDSSACVHNLT